MTTLSGAPHKPTVCPKTRVRYRRQAAGGVGVDAVELVSHRHADGLKSFEAGPTLGDMPPEQLGVPVLGDASVTIRRSCGASERVRARWGDSRPCSRMSRSRRLRDTRTPSIARSLAQTFRCPSPVHGDRSRSAWMAASNASSPTLGLGPRRAEADAGATAPACGGRAA